MPETGQMQFQRVLRTIRKAKNKGKDLKTVDVENERKEPN